MKAKAKKVEPKQDRIRFVMANGDLIMNRKTNLSVYYHHGRADVELLNYSLTKDANEHGVKIVKYEKVDANTIEALVEWKA